jgi:hypothetical protein
METEKKVTDKLRDAIMDYVYDLDDDNGKDLTALALIEATITDVEDVIASLEKERDRYRAWWSDDRKIINAIKGS